MTRHEKSAIFSRRAVLKAGGALVVSIGAPISSTSRMRPTTRMRGAAKPPLTPDQLSSYIAVNADGTVAAYFGKMDMGQGLFIAIGQIVAEELDVPFKAVKVFMGDTATSVNQGGASGSTGIQDGGKQMRMAAAEARRVLVEMAAEKLGVAGRPAHGHRRRRARQERRHQEGQLRRTDRRALLQRPARLEQANTAIRSTRPARRSRKIPKDHKIVGQPIKREDIAPKVFAQEDFCTDVKVPGMVHGRMIRPAVAGAVPVKVDESSIKDIPGAKVVWDKGFLGVVADKEWDAIKAAQQLKVEWSDAEPPFPDQDALYDHIRKAPVRKRAVEGKDSRQCRRGLQDRGAGDRGRIRVAVPVACQHGTGLRAGRDQGRQGHLLERHAEVALRARRPRRARSACPRTSVHVIWTPGPGSYGRNDADDAAMDAAVLAKAVGKPVRVQYMRDQGTGWDPKGPASIHTRARGDRRRRQRHRLRLHQQGLLARRRQHQRQQAVRHAGRPDARRRAQIGRRLRRAGGILRVRQQAHRLGDDPAAARPRLAAALVAPARSGRAANPLRQRVLHGRSGGGAQRRPDRVPAALRQGPARHRGHQGGGGEGRLADAAVAAQGPDRRQGLRPRHRLCAAQRHARRDRRRGRHRPPHRQDLGAQVHRRPRLRPDHQSGRPRAWRSRATSCRASAARCGKRSSSTTRT